MHLGLTFGDDMVMHYIFVSRPKPTGSPDHTKTKTDGLTRNQQGQQKNQLLIRILIVTQKIDGTPKMTIKFMLCPLDTKATALQKQLVLEVRWQGSSK